MAAIGVDVGDMFLMDLSDTMDDSSSSAFSSASSSASQQSQEVNSCKPTALSILNSSAKQNIHQRKYSNQTLLSNDTQLLQSSSQIQQRQFQNINHQVTNDHNNYKTNISINNYHRRDFNNSADIYRQSSMQHKARESLFWTPIGPNPIDADVNDYDDEDDDHDDNVRANYHNGNKRYSAGQQDGVSSVGDLLASSDSYMLRPFSGIGRGSPSPASSIASSSASSMSPIAVSRALSASTSSSVSSTGLMYQLNSGLHDNGGGDDDNDVDGYNEKDNSRQIPSAYFNINNKQNQAHNESNVGRSTYVHNDKDEDDENNIRNSNRHGNSQIFVGEYCDEDSLSEDEYSAIRNNPSEILKSIEAIARSVHDDNQLFGSLPRRQFNTGELVLSLRLA